MNFQFIRFIPEPGAEDGESSPACELGSTFDVNSLKAVSLAGISRQGAGLSMPGLIKMTHLTQVPTRAAPRERRS